MVVNFGDHGALSMMYSHFFTNKFEKIQKELTNTDIKLEPKSQNEGIKYVIFTYPSMGESTRTAQVVGDFNNWNTLNCIDLKLQDDGVFVAKLWLPTDKAYQYRFIINGERWENAANAAQYVSTPFGNENMVLAV